MRTIFFLSYFEARNGVTPYIAITPSKLAIIFTRPYDIASPMGYVSSTAYSYATEKILRLKNPLIHTAVSNNK